MGNNYRSGVDPGPILIEPEAKNTAAAVLAASIFALKKDKDAVLLVSPSDHIIPDIREFHQAISIGLSQIKRVDSNIGIKPTRPETGYGYLELAIDRQNHIEPSNVVASLKNQIRSGQIRC